MFVVDSHCDTPSQLLRCRDIRLDNSYAHVDFPKLRRGGIDACFFALYTSNVLTREESENLALRMLAAVYDALEASSDIAALARSPHEAYALKERGLTAIFLGLENGLPFGKDLSLLRLFYRAGVRYVTLTHNGDNDICDSAAEGKRWGGLSPFGREVVAEMNRIGMLVDIAHCSDKTFYDCIEASKAPIVSTHSCCRALCSHRRNLTDDQLRALADKGGVCQINFYPVFLSDAFAKELEETGLGDKSDIIEKAFRKEPWDPEKRAALYAVRDELKTLHRPGIKDVVDHIDHAVKVAGIESVGIGSDFDGIDVPPEGLEDISMLRRVFDEMSRRGYSDDEIELVAGMTFMRVLEDVARTSVL